MRYKVVFLEGWPASGKTALWACLDGAKEVFVEPLHVYVFNSLFSLGFSGKQRRKLTVREVRKALALTEYYKTEQYSYDASFPISFGANMTEYANFDFDWKKFDSEFIHSVTSHAISAEEYVEAYITCYLDSYLEGRYVGKVKTFVTMTNYFDYRRLDELIGIMDFKLVQVQRTYSEIIWSRIARKPREQDGAESQHFAPTYSQLMRSSEVQSIVSFDKFYRNRAKLYKTILLTDLIEHTELTMRKVISYLELDWGDQFLLETRDGMLISNKYRLTTHSNDVPKFRMWEKISLKFHYLIAKVFNLKFNPFSIYAMLVYFGMKLKHLLK